MKKIILPIAIVAILLVAIGGWFAPAAIQESLGAIAGPDIFSDVRIHGTLTSGGRAMATSSTAATYTLTRAEIAPYNLITWTPNVNTTLTLPATSTITDLVPNAGDVREILIYNASTTAAATITLAAGTGIDLQKNEDTADLAINGLDWAKLTFIRQADSDITVIMDEWIEAD